MHFMRVPDGGVAGAATRALAGRKLSARTIERQVDGSITLVRISQ